MGINTLPHLLERRQLLKYGAAALGTHLLAGCGGGDNPSPDCQPLYDDNGQWISDTCSHGSGGGLLEGVFTAQGQQIMKDGAPYVARGMCYSPQPVGAAFKNEPWGDFFTDFWQGIFNRDLPLMKAMGVNSIRVYSTLPFSKIYDAGSPTQSHKLFLDACHQNGISVWVGFPIDGGVYSSREPKQMERTRIGVEKLAQQVGEHPAVMGFVIANEANIGGIRDLKEFWDWIDDLGRITREQAPQKLTMTCLIDDAMHSVKKLMESGGLPHIDVIGINSYRGNQENGFDNLFSTFADITASKPKPLLVTEFGRPANVPGQDVELPGNAQDQATYIGAHWKDIASNAKNGLVSGGYVFAWSDEWWKDDSPTVQHGREEWFGIHSIKPDPGRSNPANPVEPDNRTYYPDILTPRAAVAELTKLWTAPQ